MSAYITSIGTANPEYEITQHEVLQFMQKAHGMDKEQARKLEVLYRATGIKNRYSVLEDYKKTNGFSFFPNNEDLSPFPSTKKRAQVYKEEALNLSKAAINDCLGKEFDKSSITHLVTVSCTGLFAPGLDIELVNDLGLNKSIQRTAINFMGCYAAFNALKVAHAICNANDHAKVLIVCTELCSIHFQKENTDDNYLANALFGDGSSAVLVQTQPTNGISLSLDQFFCDLLPNGSEEMAWEVGDYGFEMKLSAYVPDVIKNGVSALIKRLKENIDNFSFDYYAIHPGGRKILQVLEDALNITKSENKYAYEVLKGYGNMSSATILFVIKSIFDQLTSVDNNRQILSFAFGPGLTLESMVLTVTNHE
ncbi:type III polyketide synthase [Fulvivirga sp. RKSG066]|uniref:type III polyketide synthase n=1 Tax=Fulvivirga aurantia TaxID=2529383 RepID=UPI0012BB8C59|nr:type III polyketide synthase [Fulvivirga aurantia]MTI20422.1 type III polyketide synthase [Fulvivirga aurantia]